MYLTAHVHRDEKEVFTRMIRSNYPKLYKKKRLMSFLLAGFLGVVSCFGGSSFATYADGDDKTTEAKTEEGPSDVSPSIMKNENGRITFWEWTKVTYSNYWSVAKEAQETGNSEYVASMFVMLDENKKPLCFLSTYADDQHIFLGDGVRSMKDTFKEFGSVEGKSVDAAAREMNGNVRGWYNGHYPPGVAFQSIANVFIKEDQDGFSLKDHPEYFEKNRFYTSGGSMGVFWTKPLFSSPVGNWPYYAIKEEYNWDWTDVAAGILSSGWSLLFKNKDKALEQRNLNIPYVIADVALSRASAKTPGDQSYRTIGQQLNGNVDYYYYSSGNYVRTGTFNALVSDKQRKVDRSGSFDAISGSMPVELPQMGSDPARYDLNFTPQYLIPYRGDTKEDRWTLRGGLNPFSDYLCYYNGYIQRLAGDYFLTSPEAGSNYSGEDTMDFAGQRIFPSEDRVRNSLGSLGKSTNVSNNFYWYIGTPHTFAALMGEGGDPTTGEGSTLTVPKGQTLVVKDSSYMDANGNAVVSEGVVLAEGSTVVIEDGGVLSVEGNFINNGKIINKGGTILVKDGGTISPYLETGQGTIECCKADSGRSGDLIIMPGGKVFCLIDSKTYEKKNAEPALKLTGGGSVINYGSLIMSYAVIDTGSKIENRKDAICYAGYNRADITTMLHRSTVTKTAITKMEPIPAKYVTTDADDQSPYHTGVTGASIMKDVEIEEIEYSEWHGYFDTIEKGKKVKKIVQRLAMNKGTILTEKTATLNHTNGSTDYAPASLVNLETPEY